MSNKQNDLINNAFAYLSNPITWDDNFFHNIVIFARDLELYFNKDVAVQYRSLAVTLYDSLNN